MQVKLLAFKCGQSEQTTRDLRFYAYIRVTEYAEEILGDHTTLMIEDVLHLDYHFQHLEHIVQPTPS